jgi:threonine/homoserine/homoserine lactone efflux protein
MKDHVLMLLSAITGLVGITIKYKPVLDFTFVLLGTIGVIFIIYLTWQKIKEHKRTIGGNK